MKRKVSIAMFLTITIVTLTLVTYGYTQETQKAPKILTVGCFPPLSGAAASWGVELPRMLEMRAEEINAAGGLKIGKDTYTIRAVYYDNKARADEGMTVTKKLIFGDNVKYILGGGIGACIDAAQLITEPNKVLFSHGGWGQQNIGRGKPYSFRHFAGPFELMPPFYGFVLKKHPEIKTLALFNPNDTSGQDGTKAGKQAAEQLGIKVVADVSYERGTKEFGPLVTKLIMAKPDAIACDATPAGDAALMIKGLYEKGYKGFKLWAASAGIQSFLDIGGPGIEGTYLGMSWDFAGSKVRAGIREVAKKYIAKYHEPPTLPGMGTYTGAEVTFKSMEIAGTLDVDEVIKVMTSRKFECAIGPVVIRGQEGYGVNRQYYFPVVVSIVKEHKVVDLDELVPLAELR